MLRKTLCSPNPSNKKPNRMRRLDSLDVLPLEGGDGLLLPSLSLLLLLLFFFIVYPFSSSSTPFSIASSLSNEFRFASHREQYLYLRFVFDTFETPNSSSNNNDPPSTRSPLEPTTRLSQPKCERNVTYRFPLTHSPHLASLVYSSTIIQHG